ncbi:MAG: response regulator [Thermoanaerobaculia bacterium]|nr:response regulator [Thermoanaerobaculia bacterium]
MIYETDAKGRFTYVNAAVERVFGLDPKEVIGRHFLGLIREDFRERANAHYHGQRRDEIATTYFEFPCVPHNGREIWIGQYATLIRRSGEITGFHAIARDMTELHMAKQAHHEVEERFLAFMNNAPAINFIKDTEGKLLFVNEPFARFFERTAESMIGSSDIEIFNDDALAAVRASDLAVSESQQTVRVVESFPSPEGSMHHWLTYKFPMPGPNGSTLIGAVGIDMTDRVALEVDLADARDAALTSARLKSEFLANMSHEIRTPMNGVIGMLGVLLDTGLSDDQRDLAETARTSAEALLTIINDILDFSKIEAGKMTFEMVDFDVRQMVESALDLVTEAARKKHLELGCVIDANVPARVRGDAGRVRQVLLNLIGNGVKFTEQGGIVVRVTRKSLEDEPLVLGFNVTDSGIGITEKARKKLFQPFVQADSSTTRRFGGTGLGLVISKHLAELMHGSIGVESTPGFGSTFWFTGQFDEAQSRPEKAPAAKKTHVLLVDDSPTALHVVSAQLDALGIERATAGDAVTALRMMQAAAIAGSPFDLVISDRRMEGMDGFALVRLLRGQPMLASTRFGIISASSPSETPEALAQLGITFWLSKPVKQHQLQAAIFGKLERDDRKPAPAAPASHSSSRGRVLVVEDNNVNQRVALRQLQKLGYTGDAVGNGREALQAIERVAYDVILMDWHMPEMDGIEATTEIRRRETAGKRIPIIALTASALPEDRQTCIEAGMDDFVTKPVREADLEKALSRWVPAREAAAPAVRILDASVIEELADGDEAFVRDLLQTFLEQGDTLLRAAATAVTTSDSKSFMTAVHTLAGSSRNVGAVPLADHCTLAENAIRAGDESDLDARIRTIRAAFAAVKDTIATRTSLAA